MLNPNQKTDLKILKAASAQIVELIVELEERGLETTNLELHLRDLGVRILKLLEQE